MFISVENIGNVLLFYGKIKIDFEYCLQRYIKIGMQNNELGTYIFLYIMNFERILHSLPLFKIKNKPPGYNSCFLENSFP